MGGGKGLSHISLCSWGSAARTRCAAQGEKRSPGCEPSLRPQLLSSSFHLLTGVPTSGLFPQAARGPTVRGHLPPGEGDSPPIHSRCSGVPDPGGCCCWQSCAWGRRCAAPKPGRARGRLSKSCSLSPRWLSVRASVSTDSLAQTGRRQGWVGPQAPTQVVAKVFARVRGCANVCECALY